MCDPASIDTMFAACEAELGVVDAVVNNAGLSYPGWLHEVSNERDHHRGHDEPHRADARVPAGGRRALRNAERTGDIVFITSDAVRYARPRQGVYAGTKAGLEQFARSLGWSSRAPASDRRPSASARASPSSARHGTWTRSWSSPAYWQHYGLQRHFGLLDAADVGRAVATVVTTRPGIMYDTLEIQPECPVGDDRTLSAGMIGDLLPPH